MDLSALLSAFPPDAPGPRRGGRPAASPVASVVDALGGVSLSGGLYRVFDADGVADWSATAAESFPAFEGRVTVFAADWLGRLFAADAARRDKEGSEIVLMLEPGTGEVLEIPCTVEAVHTAELLEAADALVAAGFYEEWRAESEDTAPLDHSECVGYRVPLFLGGGHRGQPGAGGHERVLVVHGSGSRADGGGARGDLRRVCERSSAAQAVLASLT